MKMNKKIIVSTLALAMGAALAGSVSGTVAWFQYSTRAQAAYIGTTAHCSEALEIQATKVGGSVVEANWSTELKAEDVATALGTSATDLKPITTGAVADPDVALSALSFKSNPIYQHFAYNEWVDATAANYQQFELHFRVKDINGAQSASYLAKELYLLNIDIVSMNAAGTAEDTTSNLYEAIRVHVSADDDAYHQLFAKGAATNTGATVSTDVGAKLDLNNDGEYDSTPAYEWGSGTETAYGTEGGVQVANNVRGSGIFAVDTNPAQIVANSGDLGEIAASDDGFKVTVTIWLEGWTKLATGVTDNKEEEDTSVWNTSYIGAKFGVGFRFACETHTETEHNA